MNIEVELLLNRKTDLYSAVALLSNSLSEFKLEDNAGRKKVVSEIATIEEELNPILERLDVFFQTKTLPPAPELPAPKFDPTNEADCLRRRNALHKKKSVLKNKLKSSPDDLVIQDQIKAVAGELLSINESLKR